MNILRLFEYLLIELVGNIKASPIALYNILKSGIHIVWNEIILLHSFDIIILLTCILDYVISIRYEVLRHLILTCHHILFFSPISTIQIVECTFVDIFNILIRTLINLLRVGLIIFLFIDIVILFHMILFFC